MVRRRATRFRRRPIRVRNMSLNSTWLPTWMTEDSLIQDSYETLSSELQQETAKECLPYLVGGSSPRDSLKPVNEFGIPRLQRASHVEYCRMMLGRLPAAYAALDASRPWMLYWCLSSLALLGEDVSEYRSAVVSSLRPLQNSSGGFAGGHGQYSHLATSYASLLSLVIVGGEEAYRLVDRKAMWNWLGALKQPEGDFQMCLGGESDTRGAYCAMVITSLLNLPISLPSHSPAHVSGNETLLTGLAEWLGQCQAFDGGISSAPGTESHGAYTFCALACLCLLGQPSEVMNKVLDVPLLVDWLATRQHAPEGGLAGRANKLVDGCYSHWIGGCWSLVEAAVGLSQAKSSAEGQLFNREGLIRYILCCCQSKRGGLRDKPSKRADAYHTCYNLNGLSSAQHLYHNAGDRMSEGSDKPFESVFRWSYSAASREHGQNDSHGQNPRIYNANDEVCVIHPVYIVPFGTAESMRKYFESNADL